MASTVLVARGWPLVLIGGDALPIGRDADLMSLRARVRRAGQHPRMSTEPSVELLGAWARRRRRDVSSLSLGVPWNGHRMLIHPSFVFSRSRMTRVVGTTGVAAVIVASAAAAAIVLAFHNPARTVRPLGTPEGSDR